MSQQCNICSNLFFSTIFNAALKKDEEFITEALKLKRNSRLNFVKEKIPNFIFNFKFEEYEKEMCEDRLQSMGIDCYVHYDEDVLNLIALKDYLLLNYYVKQAIKHDFITVDFAVNEAKKERERRADKFIKNFLKEKKIFKLQNEREGCDCLLLFNPAHTKIRRVIINDDKNEDQNDMLKEWRHKIYFLKNKNPRDSKQNNFAFIDKMKPSPKGLSIKNHS